MLKKIMMLGVSSMTLSVSLAATMPALKTERDKLSYALGMMTGKTFRAHAINVDTHWFSQGFSDEMQGNKPLLSNDEAQKIVQNFQLKNQQEARAKQNELAAKNQAAGEKFLAENKQKPGVVTLKDGLQYKVLKSGDMNGMHPALTDTVVVNYEGRTIDGKVFDSSYQRGRPASFTLNQVIKGWQQALQLMRPGDQWELYVPAKLAYGDYNVPNIGPNQVLIFKIDLISVKKKK